MKTILILLLFSLFSCQSHRTPKSIEERKKNMLMLKEKIISCILSNKNSSELLINTLKENKTEINSILSLKRLDVNKSDRRIINLCGRIAFEEIREERNNDPEKYNLGKYSKYGEKMYKKSQERLIENFRKSVLDCLEVNAINYPTLINYLGKIKNNTYDYLFLQKRENLTDQEKDIVIKCKRDNIKILKGERNKNQEKRRLGKKLK